MKTNEQLKGIVFKKIRSKIKNPYFSVLINRIIDATISKAREGYISEAEHEKEMKKTQQMEGVREQYLNTIVKDLQETIKGMNDEIKHIRSFAIYKTNVRLQKELTTLKSAIEGFKFNITPLVMRFGHKIEDGECVFYRQRKKEFNTLRQLEIEINDIMKSQMKEALKNVK